MEPTVELSPKQYAEMLTPKCTPQNITQKIRNGGYLKGVIEIKKLIDRYILVVDVSKL